MAFKKSYLSKKNLFFYSKELKSKSRIDIQQVRYDADVNVRENFPTNSDALFNASKIQRDTFYDILTDWKNNHKQENSLEKSFISF